MPQRLHILRDILKRDDLMAAKRCLYVVSEIVGAYAELSAATGLSGTCFAVPVLHRHLAMLRRDTAQSYAAADREIHLGANACTAFVVVTQTESALFAANG